MENIQYFQIIFTRILNILIKTFKNSCPPQFLLKKNWKSVKLAILRLSSIFELLQSNDTMFYRVFDLLLCFLYYYPSYIYKHSFLYSPLIDYSKGYKKDIIHHLPNLDGNYSFLKEMLPSLWRTQTSISKGFTNLYVAPIFIFPS